MPIDIDFIISSIKNGRPIWLPINYYAKKSYLSSMAKKSLMAVERAPSGSPSRIF